MRFEVTILALALSISYWGYSARQAQIAIEESFVRQLAQVVEYTECA